MKFEYDFERKRISIQSDPEHENIENIEFESNDTYKRLRVGFDSTENSDPEQPKSLIAKIADFITEWKVLITTIVIPSFAFVVGKVTDKLKHIPNVVRYAIIFVIIAVIIVIIYRKKNKK